MPSKQFWRYQKNKTLALRLETTRTATTKPVMSSVQQYLKHWRAEGENTSYQIPRVQLESSSYRSQLRIRLCNFRLRLLEIHGSFGKGFPMTDKREPTFHLSDDEIYVVWEHDCPPLVEQGFHIRISEQLPIRNNKWHLVKREPLTTAPSIQCSVCGLHGFITEGKWVSA